MTVAVNDRRKEYPGNGTTTVFDGPRAFSASHIAVYLVDDATGTATLSTAYTLTNTGGRRATTVTMDTAPVTGATLLILRTVPYEQGTDITNQGAYLPEVVEQALDLLVQQTQQLADQGERTLRFADTMLEDIDPTVPVGVPLGLIGFNAANTGLDVYPPETFVAAATAGVAHQYNVARGDTTLDVSDIVTPFGIGQVFYNGVFQNPASYAVASGVMTYSEALPADGVVTVIAVFASPDAVTNSEQLFHLLNATGATTRSLRSKLAESVYVEDFGAVGDGVTDDYTAITNAIAYVAGLGGGEVRFADKEYAVGTGVVVSSPNVYLRGVGYQKHGSVNAAAATRWTQYGGTILKWIGATGAGDVVLSFKPAATGPLLHGVGYEGILIDCDAKASYGLEILSVQGGRFPRIHAADALTRNVHIGVMPSGPWTSIDPRDTQHCWFGQVFSRSWLTAALAADGILIDGDDSADVSVDQFGEIFYIHKDGKGLTLKSSDALVFGQTFGYRIPGGTGVGVSIEGGVSATDHPRNHFFGFIQPGPGGLTLTANTVAPTGIVAACYSLGNGTPVPVIGTGCGLSYITDSGTARLSRTGGAATQQYARPGAVVADNIDLIEQRAPNAAGTTVVYSKQQTRLTDTTAGSEDAVRDFAQMVNGVETVVLSLGDGIQVKQGSFLKRLLTATASLDFPSVAAGGGVQALTIACPGAALFDSVSLGLPSNGGTNGLVYSAYVSAVDTVTVRVTNATAGALDPAAQTFRVTVLGF